MAVGLIPFGMLADGKYGILVKSGTNVSLAAAVEILDTLPLVTSTDNFPGRTVFITANSKAYIFSNVPTPTWNALQGTPATVGSVNGVPPVTPVPSLGELFWDTDTLVLFVWDGTSWVYASGIFNQGIVNQRYLGDGTTLSFPLGIAVPNTGVFAEVYIDGVHQVQSINGVGDYDLVGYNVIFREAPAANTRVEILTWMSQALLQNAQVRSFTALATANQKVFTTQMFGVDPASTFVYVNGSLSVLGVDYSVVSQTTTITAITSSPTPTPSGYDGVARIQTTQTHGLTAGSTLRIRGSLEWGMSTTDPINNEAGNAAFLFTVISAPTSNLVDIGYTTDKNPIGLTPSPVLYFFPPSTADQIVFVNGLAANRKVDVRCLQNAIRSPPTGEANTIASLGTGQPIAAGKTGTTLLVKSLTGGSNISLTSDDNTITINSSSSLEYEDRVGINSTYYMVDGTESYIGVRNTSSTVVIDLTGILVGAISSGRRVTIKDESGGAATNNIFINGGVGNIDGVSGYSITTNYGSVTMVYDGLNWFIIGRKI